MSGLAHMLGLGQRPRGDFPAIIVPEFAGRVASGSHDAEEVLSSGLVRVGSADIELGEDDFDGAHAVGLLWETNIPQGVPINSAFLQFVSSEGGLTDDCMVRIWCEAADSPSEYTDANGDISGRAKTTAFVDWDIPAWTSEGQEDADTTSPDLSGPVKEVVDREGFSGVVGFIIETSPNNVGATPRRAAKSRDLTAGGAPLFTVNGGEETGGGDAPAAEYGLLGNESFNRLDLDDTATDDNGLTLRDWYDKLLAGGTSNEYDWAFDRPENRPSNRQGNMYVTSLIIGLRLLGDLKLLDEAVRLLELKYAHLSTDSNGYLFHDDTNGFDQDLDVRQMYGPFARVMYACHVNRALTSPAGHNYGAIADKYHTFLVDHYLPRWRGKEGTHLPEGIDHDGGTGRSSWSNTLSILYYCAKKGGGGGFTQAEWDNEVAAAFDQNFLHDAVCGDGHNGRDTLVFPHSAFPVGASDTAQELIYVTYVRYVIVGSLELWMEGADSRFNETWLTRFANSFADYVIMDSSFTDEELARSLGGEQDRCGIEYREWGDRMDNVDIIWQTSAYAYLEGFDGRGRIINFGTQMYSSVSQSVADDYPNYPAARIFTRIHHGW